MCYLQETYFRFKHTDKLKVKGGKKKKKKEGKRHAMQIHKRAIICILIPHKINFKPKIVTRGAPAVAQWVNDLALSLW